MPLVVKPQPGAASAAAPTVADIAAALSSSSEQVRWDAARAAAGQTGGAALLANALRVETAPRVREALLTSLAAQDDADSVAAVLPLLRSDDASLRTGALDALRIMRRGLRALLPALLQDADADVRILSCELARALPGEEASPLLCELLRREPDPNVCGAAVDVLAEVGQREALPVLAECAARFRDSPFLSFAMQAAAVRIGNQSAPDRG